MCVYVVYVCVYEYEGKEHKFDIAHIIRLPYYCQQERFQRAGRENRGIKER